MTDDGTDRRENRYSRRMVKAAVEQEAAQPNEGPQRRKSRLRRQKILDKASESFGAKGFHATSLADIAEQVGITPAGILHHFRTKEVLLTELLRMRDAEDIKEVKRGDRPPRGVEFLRHLIDTAYHNQERRGTTQLYAVLSAESVTDEHPAQQWFRDRYDGLRSMIMDAIGEAKEDGELAVDLDAGLIARSIIAVMDGLQVQWLLEPDTVDMGAATRYTIESFVHISIPPTAELEPAGGAPDPSAES